MKLPSLLNLLSATLLFFYLPNAPTALAQEPLFQCTYENALENTRYALVLRPHSQTAALYYEYQTPADKFRIRGEVVLEKSSEWSGRTIFNGRDSNGTASISVPATLPRGQVFLTMNFSEWCREPSTSDGCWNNPDWPVPESPAEYLDCVSIP